MAVFLERIDHLDAYQIRRCNKSDSILLGTVDYRKKRAAEIDNHFPIYWNDSINPARSHVIGSFNSPERASQTVLEYARAHAPTLLTSNEPFFDLTLESKLVRVPS